jgi:hypothetical protein
VFKRLTNLGNLVGTQAHLARFSARIAHGEDPQRVALAAGAFRTSRGVVDGAMEQGAAQDLGWGAELGGESFALADDLVLILATRPVKADQLERQWLQRHGRGSVPLPSRLPLLVDHIQRNAAPHHRSPGPHRRKLHFAIDTLALTEMVHLLHHVLNLRQPLPTLDHFRRNRWATSLE